MSKEELSGVPGNTIEESRIHEAYLRRVAVGWVETVRGLERLAGEGIEVHRITLRGGWSGQGDFLLVLAADTAEGPKVAFHGCDEETLLWVSLAKRMARDGLKWKDDEYAK